MRDNDILLELEMSRILPLQEKIFKDGMKSVNCSVKVSNVIYS